jgi:rubredoxin
MTPETYVIGSILLSVMVVAIQYGSDPSDFNPIDDALKCPRCGAQMQDIGSGVGCGIGRSYVVPRIFVLKCPQCGYSERSWA